ncbi:alpha-amylase [Trifolium repens]|nr:alpha-amylase [Trifolium repens]
MGSYTLNFLLIGEEGLYFQLLQPVLARLQNEENGFNTSLYFPGHWTFARDKLMHGYAYILRHPGTRASIFSLPLSLPVKDNYNHTQPANSLCNNFSSVNIITPFLFHKLA